MEGGRPPKAVVNDAFNNDAEKKIQCLTLQLDVLQNVNSELEEKLKGKYNYNIIINFLEGLFNPKID